MQAADPFQVQSDISVFTKYAKHLPEQQRRETYLEVALRNRDMHAARYPHLAEEIDRVYDDFVLPMKVLPSMRSLQFGGTAAEVNNARIYNCAYAPVDSIDIFGEAMFLLLGGTGFGYSVQWRHVSKLPPISMPTKARRYLIGDSIEGWADAVKMLVKAYFGRTEYRPVFDYSDIRPKGARLVTSGGKAPGPAPLKRALERIEIVLASKATGHKLESLEAHDILCHLADAVLAGGIRRAAMISLFDADDEAMLRAKSSTAPARLLRVIGPVEGQSGTATLAEVQLQVEPGVHTTVEAVLSEYDLATLQEQGLLGWWAYAPQRARANNSAVLIRGVHEREVFDAVFTRAQESGAGEPGVYWTSDPDLGTNPCAEISLRPFQFCNLTEINGDGVVDQTDLNARAEAAAFLGTLQASWTDFHYLRPIWRETTEEDALLGVGITGIASGDVQRLDLAQAAEHASSMNLVMADALGIKPAARVTTVKPSGTSSLVLGTSSGIHAWHAPYYIRRMRFNGNEAIIQYLRQRIPDLIEENAFEPGNYVLSLPAKAPEGAITRGEESAESLLERVSDFHARWVRSGHRNGGNTNNVSATITVKPDEWDFVREWMWDHRDHFNGLALMPYNDHSYVQAPFEDCDEETYLRMVSLLDAIDLTQVMEADDMTDLVGELACAGGACEIDFEAVEAA